MASLASHKRDPLAPAPARRALADFRPGLTPAPSDHKPARRESRPFHLPLIASLGGRDQHARPVEVELFVHALEKRVLLILVGLESTH